MARRRPPRGGPTLPPDAAPIRISGVMHTAMGPFGLQVKKWPPKRPGKLTPGQIEQNANFRRMVSLVNQVPAWDRVAATTIAHGSGWTWRDVLSKCVTGRFWEIPGLEASAVPYIMDILSNVEGAMLYRGPSGWVGLLPDGDGKVIALTAGLPGWVDPSTLPIGITQLHGDIAAGPGTGNVLATIANSGVTAGVYHHTTLQVSADGRIIDAISGANATTSAVGLVKPDGTSITIDVDGTIHGASSAIAQLTGAVTAGPGSGAQAATITPTGVTAAAYHHATVTVNAAGQVTAAADGAVATSSAVGLVKPDATTIAIDGTGKLNAIVATLTANGIVRPDGTTITIDGTGKLTALEGGGGGIGGLFSAAMSSRVTQTGSGPWTNAGTGTVTDTNSGMVLNSGTGTAWLTKNIPSGIHAAAALFQQTALTATNTECYIGFGDGTKAVLAALEWNGSAWRYVVYRWNAFNSFGSTAFQGPTNHVNSWLWLKAYDDGTRINFYFSNDGVNWINYYNELRLANLASVSKLVLASYSGAGGVACNTLVSSYLESAS